MTSVLSDVDRAHDLGDFAIQLGPQFRPCAVQVAAQFGQTVFHVAAQFGQAMFQFGQVVVHFRPEFGQRVDQIALDGAHVFARRHPDGQFVIDGTRHRLGLPSLDAGLAQAIGVSQGVDHRGVHRRARWRAKVTLWTVGRSVYVGNQPDMTKTRHSDSADSG